MKKIISLLSVVLAAFSAYAQDAQSAAAAAADAIVNAPAEKVEAPKPNYWKTSVQFDLGLNQTGLFNWAAGGYNTMSLAAGIDAKADYAKDCAAWNNRLQLNYGFLWSADKKNLLQKSTDRIYLESKYAYKTAADSKWNYTASLDFRSQFTNSYDDYKQDPATEEWSGTLKSGFFAPAYTNLALGMEWKPTDWFNVNFAPLTGGLVAVSNPILRETYGMPKDGDAYKNVLFQFGAQVKANVKAVVNDVFTYETQVVFFTDYLNKPFNWNRVNWDNKISWQLSKLFKIGLDTWMIYDPLVAINGTVSKVQFKEFISVNFTYKISGK